MHFGVLKQIFIAIIYLTLCKLNKYPTPSTDWIIRYNFGELLSCYASKIKGESKGELQADKLQTKVLPEPDYDYMNKFVDKHLPERAEEQFWSRKNHTKINQVVRFLHSILWGSRKL